MKLGGFSITGLSLGVINAHGFDKEDNLNIIPCGPEKFVHTIVAPLDVESRFKSSTVLTPRYIELAQKRDVHGERLGHSIILPKNWAHD